MLVRRGSAAGGAQVSATAVLAPSREQAGAETIDVAAVLLSPAAPLGHAAMSARWRRAWIDELGRAVRSAALACCIGSRAHPAFLDSGVAMTHTILPGRASDIAGRAGAPARAVERGAVDASRFLSICPFGHPWRNGEWGAVPPLTGAWCVHCPQKGGCYIWLDLFDSPAPGPASGLRVE